MAESLNRKIARRYSKAVSNENFRSDGTLFATATVYDSTADLPTSNVTRGAQGYVSSNQRLYIRGTGGWYNIATINNTPSINSVQTAGGDSSPFRLATDGATTTVITITATDSEGFPITFSAVTDVGFDSIATVSQDSSVFTITPFSSDSAGTASSGTLTFKATDGVNIASEVATFTLTFQVANSNFTTLLMKASGNNGTNTTITDTSSDSPANNTAHTITVNGNTSNQAFTPYHPGGYSTYFDGTGDFLSYNPGASIAFGTGPFTVEAWVYHTAALGSNAIIDTRGGGTANWVLYRDTSNGGRIQWYNGSSNTYSTGTNKWSAQNEWLHIAYCRSGTTGYFFINGELLNTQTDSTNYSTSSTELTIGARYSQDTAFFQGYIKDLRIVKGTAVYTAAFTPPTQTLIDITNTSLLACNLPYIADKSSNSYSITVSGNTKVERFSPYDHKNYGASEHGSSVYFDGSGDYLTIPTSADFNFGTGDYTIEFWHWPENIEIQSIIDQRSADSENVPLIWLNGSGYYYVYINGSTVISSGNNSVKVGQWYHVVLQKSSNVTRLFINGVQKGVSYTDNLTYVQGSTFHIGRRYTGTTYYLDGHLCDFRIVKGTAVHNHSGFTPPTTPLTAIANTKLLTFNDTANVFNAAGTSNNVVLGGTAKSSTAQKKNASASVLFDGNSDYVELSNYNEYAPGTQDFVVEFWMRYTGGSGTRNVVDNRGQANGYAIRLDSSNKITVYSEPSSSTKHTSASALTQDQWYHVAFVRNNGANSYLFIDGTQSGSTATNTDNYTSTSMVIGAQHAKNTQYFPGYVEDARITKGLVRYPFIPFSSTLSASDVSGTQLLACHAATIVDGTDTHTINSNSSPAVVDFGPHPGMKSVSFDGTDDRLYIADGDYKNFGTGEYTIECWIYPEETSQGTFGDYFWGDGQTGSNSSGSNELMYTTDDKLKWYFVTTGGNNTITSTFALTPYTWYHVACQRKGNVFQMFINGSLAVSSNAGAVTMNDSSGVWTIGDYGHTYGTTAPPKCKISNFRMVKGTAVYNDSFTPPTNELTA